MAIGLHEHWFCSTMDIKIYCIDLTLIRKYNNESKIEKF
jgi:hypothetical protein